MYELFNQKGKLLWSGDERSLLLVHLAVRRRPPAGGRHSYALYTRVEGQRLVVHHIVMTSDGHVFVTAAETHQSLPDISLDQLFGDPALAEPPPAYPPPPIGRSVWLRLRDPWPWVDPPPPPETPAGLSNAEWESFLSWDRTSRAARNEGVP